MDIVFGPDGNFDEVYLYEELMEADLHAIVRLTTILVPSFGADLSDRMHSFFVHSDPFRPTALRRALPVLHLPNALRS